MRVACGQAAQIAGRTEPRALSFTSERHAEMLPTPASFVQRGGHYTRMHGGSGSPAQWRSYLQARSRTTNLAVGLCAAVCAISLLLNLHFWLASGPDFSGRIPGARSGAALAYSPLSILSTLDGRMRGLDHLVMVGISRYRVEHCLTNVLRSPGTRSGTVARPTSGWTTATGSWNPSSANRSCWELSSSIFRKGVCTRSSARPIRTDMQG